MLWSTAKGLISPTSLHTSRGWAETLSHIREAYYGEAIWTSAAAILSHHALWHAFVGNKRVSLFDLRDQKTDTRENLTHWILNKASSDLSSISSGNHIAIHETPTKQEDLESHKGAPPRLIGALLQNSKLYLQFFSARSYIKKETLEKSKMGNEQALFFREYDEIIGVRSRYIPCFDIVVFDAINDLIEFRLDFQPGMAEDKNAPAFQRLMQAVSDITTRFVGHSAVGAGLINFHPVVNPLYLDEGCGRVTTLGFVATSNDTSSNNQGRIHRTKTQDFRKDKFHLGGKRNVNKIEPYAIGVTWGRNPPKCDLYLELKGNARAIYAGSGAITEAEFQGCLDGQDYDFISSQVLSRLNRKSK